MTVPAVAIPSKPPLQKTRFPEALCTALGVVIMSDWLFYQAAGVRSFGLSLVLLAVAIAAGALGLNRVTANSRTLVLAGGAYLLATLPLLENISALSLLVTFGLYSLISLWLADELRGAIVTKLYRLIGFFLSAPFTIPVNFLRWRARAAALAKPMLRFASVGVWIMPLVIGMIFLLLFSQANPLIATWISYIDIRILLDLLDPPRIIFWIIIACFSWPFLSPIVFKPRAEKTIKENKQLHINTFEDIVFGKGAILRSLFLFNILFGLQTLLDATYLVGGAVLPDHLTLAQYAHRGAYPLIITALMAALFVIIALREGSEAKDSRLIRGLVYLWIFQNVLLVLASVYRLDLYVQSYSLTYLRVAAFIWMALVAIGLILIVARLLFNKSSEWLIGANLAIALTVIYACCFVNFANIIAGNIMSSKIIDFDYVAELGAPAIPAIDERMTANLIAGPQHGPQAKQFNRNNTYLNTYAGMKYWRDREATEHLSEMTQWRAWTLRGLRLKHYLITHPTPATTPSEQGRDRR